MGMAVSVYNLSASVQKPWESGPWPEHLTSRCGMYTAAIKINYPIYDQHDWKTTTFGAVHTYIACIRSTHPRINPISLYFFQQILDELYLSYTYIICTKFNLILLYFAWFHKLLSFNVNYAEIRFTWLSVCLTVCSTTV